jgi:hypothetical protein
MTLGYGIRHAKFAPPCIVICLGRTRAIWIIAFCMRCPYPESSLLRAWPTLRIATAHCPVYGLMHASPGVYLGCQCFLPCSLSMTCRFAFITVNTWLQRCADWINRNCVFCEVTFAPICSSLLQY